MEAVETPVCGHEARGKVALCHDGEHSRRQLQDPGVDVKSQYCGRLIPYLRDKVLLSTRGDMGIDEPPGESTMLPDVTSGYYFLVIKKESITANVVGAERLNIDRQSKRKAKIRIYHYRDNEV